jgi:hypothetical protein
VAKKKPQAKAKPTAKPAKVAGRRGKSVGTKPDPRQPADLAKAFQLEIQSVPPPPPNSVVTLDPDVAPHFPNSRAVNEALRALVRIVRQVRSGGT